MTPERKKEVQTKYRHSPKGRAKAAEYRERNREKLRAYMREYGKSHKEENNARARKWVSENTERDKENKMIYREHRRQLKREKIAAAGGCVICGLKYDGNNSCVFDLHHINPFQKVKTPGNCRGVPQFKQEARKCSVVCSNCHRMLHKAEV